MKSKKMKVVLSGLLATSMALSYMGTGIVFANDDGSVTSQTIEGLMSKLPENQKNYLEVTAGEKIKLKSDINLESEETIEIIVELISDPVVVQESKSNVTRTSSITDLEAEHEEFKNQINKTKSVYNLQFGYEFTEVFNGIAMTVPANQIETLAEMDIVKAIWSNEEVQLEIPEEDTANYFTTDGVTPYMFDSIPGIGVDKLHDEGIKGENIKVGVLDTGVDYNHPDLKSAYKGGYDFVDNDDDPMETTYEEWLESGYPEVNSQGSEYYTSHGTHVSGTILGRGENSVDTAITGVAPKAELYAYRVLGSYGQGDVESIVAAIDKAVKDGMDVINLSLGISVNNPLSPESIAINNCMLYSDTVAVVAAGNSGSAAYTLGSPGAAPLAITVGANSSEMSLNTVEGDFLNEKYDLTVFAKDWNISIEDLLNNPFAIEYVGLGSEEDFVDKDLNGKIALIERGTLTFVDKIANAKKAGAVATIIYNNVEGDMSVYLGESKDYIMSLSMSKEQGEALKSKLAESESREISFDNVGVKKSEGNKLADFSSRGPVTNSLDIKPELTAPGESILSTVPGYINDKDAKDNFDYNISYGRMSGTSMATPHITGVVALMISQHKDYSPLDIKTVLMNTTEELNGDYSVFEVGAGRVNAYEAVKSNIKIQVNDVISSTDENGETVEINDITGDFSFGRQAKDAPVVKNFTVVNSSDKNKEFKITTIFTTSIVSPVSNPEDEGIVINLSDTISIEAGQSINETLEINVPMSATNGTYEGYVILTNVDDHDEDYRLPFAINVGEKFINIEVLDKEFSLGEFHPYQAMPGFWVGFEVSDQFDTLDVLIKDGETDEYIGYVGSLLTDSLPTNTYLEAGTMVSNGYYIPILKNSNGEYYVDVNTMKLSRDQRYTIEFLAVDKSGEVIKSEDDYFVDSIPPTVVMNEGYEPGIYEVKCDEVDTDEVFRLYGSVYDEYVDYAKKFGLETSQADNLLGYLEKSDNISNQGILTLGENGEINVGYPISQINEDGVINLQMYPIDRATSGDFRVGMLNYYFIKKGLPYISTTCDKTNFKVGDTGTVKMSGKYLSDFKLGKFNVTLPVDNNEESIYEISSITPSVELENLLNEKGLKLEIDYEKTEVFAGEETIAVTCEVKGENTLKINGDIELLNFNFTVVSDLYYESMRQIMNIGEGNGFDFESKISTEDTEGNIERINVLNDNKGIVKVDNSYIIGTVVPEGSVDEDGRMEKTLEDMDTVVNIISPEGTVTIPELDAGYMGYIQCDTIPVMDGVYRIISETPGHLSATSEQKLTYIYDGELFGALNNLKSIRQYGGDVNGDGIIDIIDAVIIARAIGKEVPEVKGICRDINRDGLVGEVDLDYVVRNFGKVDGLREGIATVQKTFQGMDIDEVIENGSKLYEDKGPEITINIEDGKVYNSEVSIEVTSEDLVYSVHDIYINGELFEGNSVCEEGAYEVKVKAMDDLGNTSEKVVNFQIALKEEVEEPDGPGNDDNTPSDDNNNNNTDNDKVNGSTSLDGQVDNIDKENSVNVNINKQLKPGMPITGAIIGSVVIVIVAIAIIVSGIFLFKKKKK